MNAKAESLIPELALLGTTLRAMDAITNGDDTVNTTARMKALCDMESEQEEKAPELDVADMNDAELRACILHDPDMVTRRRALARFGALRYSEGCADQAKAARGVRS